VGDSGKIKLTLLLRKMIGNYKNKLDDKGRIIIPSKNRSELGDFIVISYGFDNTLEIRTSESFSKWSQTLSKKGNLSSNSRELSRIILGNSFEVTIDKSGRALLPKQLTDLIKLTKDVMLIGIGDKIEVHPAKQWGDITSNPEEMTKNLEQMAEELSKSE